jgi:hypothetical protein
MVAVLAFVVVGCAITDYSGRAGEQTSSEAKLMGKQISFTGAGDQSGTYIYTAKYNRRTGNQAVTITSYLNPVPSSFDREGVVDRDGDDVQGRSGVLGGTFSKFFVAVDNTPDGGCEFADNLTFNASSTDPGLSLCVAGAVEEADRDLALQASFGSIDDLLGQIWSGAVGGDFTVEIEGLTLNGVPVQLPEAFSLASQANGVRPTTVSVDLSQPGSAKLIQSLLANTEHNVPVTVGVQFAGGMSIDLPSHLQVAFNHDVLWGLL